MIGAGLETTSGNGSSRVHTAISFELWMEGSRRILSYPSFPFLVLIFLNVVARLSPVSVSDFIGFG